MESNHTESEASVPCINLMERFGARYRITFDEAYDPRHRPKDSLDPWYMQIACRRGIIYSYGGTLLAVEVDGRPVTAGRLRSLPCTGVVQDGDNEVTFVFDLADFATIAGIVHPRRRRQVSDVERQRLASMGAKYGFSTHRPEQLCERRTHAEPVR